MTSSLIPISTIDEEGGRGGGSEVLSSIHGSYDIQTNVFFGNNNNNAHNAKQKCFSTRKRTNE